MRPVPGVQRRPDARSIGGIGVQTLKASWPAVRTEDPAAPLGGSRAACWIAGLFLAIFGTARAAGYLCPPEQYLPPDGSAFWQPMRYRSTPTPRGIILLAEGEIMEGESQRLALRIRQAMSTPQGVSEVRFNSPGGDSTEGQLMGRALRNLAVPTRIASGAYCVSACSVAFLGGVFRTVENGGHYAVHMFSEFGGTDSGQSVQETVKRLQRLEQDSAQRAAERYQYLLEMGVSPNVAKHGFEVEHNETSCPPNAVLRKWNVDNAD